MKKFILIIAVLFLFSSGCSSYHPTRPVPLSTNPTAQQSKKTNNGIESMVFPITTQSMQKQVFNKNIIKNGVLPIQINILNNRDNNITFTNNTVTLFTPEGIVIKAISSLNVAQHTSKSIWRTLGLETKTDAFGLIPSGLNTPKTSKRNQEDYAAKPPIEGDLVPGAMVDGVIFFKLPEEQEIKNLDGYTINIPLIDNINSDKNCNISHALYGDINY